MIDADTICLPGDLQLPEEPKGLVILAHGSGCSRSSARNRHMARVLLRRGFATLQLDLLTPVEDRDCSNRLDIPLLSQRLDDTTAWTQGQPGLRHLPLAYVGAGTGAAAALHAAAHAPARISVIVSRSGRPELAMGCLPCIRAPTLLIVGGADDLAIKHHRRAYAQLCAPKRLAVIPGTTHLFREPRAMHEVTTLTANWLDHHCAASTIPALIRNG